MIEIDQVSYRYPNAERPTLRDLSLTIDEGEFLLVCGPSGAGKSTFLRLLNGLVPHFYGGRIAGDVRLWGRSIRSHQPRDLADLVGFVFQDPEAQFVVDIVEDEIVFAMENLGLPLSVMRRRVEEVLDQLDIAELRHRHVSSLSGGERQRVAIAAVLAAQPRVLALDEPTSQLDPHAAEQVLTTLQKLNADLGLTVVLSEHRLERVVQYADRMLYLPGTDAETRRPGDQETRRPGDQESEPQDTFLVLPSPWLPVLGSPREVLAQIDLTPPLVEIGRALGWTPLPLTIKEGRQFTRAARTTDLRLSATSTPPTPGDDSRAAPATVTLSHVHFSYGEHEALYDLSISARPGEVLAIMGRNGSGKTTLLKLIIGLLRPQRGAVMALGRDVTRLEVEDIAAFVGYVPQNPHTLLFHDTLRDELAFTLDQRPATSDRQPATPVNRGSSNAERHSPAIKATLDRFGLAHLAQSYPRDLSGGEAQRAALATILVGNPQLLLLDEPTRGLDYSAKATLGRLLRALAAEQRTILMATHDVELVAAYADRVVLLGDGELVVDGPVREVLSDSLIFSSQTAKLFPGTGWLTAADVAGHTASIRKE